MIAIYINGKFRDHPEQWKFCEQFGKWCPDTDGGPAYDRILFVAFVLASIAKFTGFFRSRALMDSDTNSQYSQL